MEGDTPVPSVRMVRLVQRAADQFLWVYEDGTDYSPIFKFAVGAKSWLFTPVIVEPWQPQPPVTPPENG